MRRILKLTDSLDAADQASVAATLMLRVAVVRDGPNELIDAIAGQAKETGARILDGTSRGAVYPHRHYQEKLHG